MRISVYVLERKFNAALKKKKTYICLTTNTTTTQANRNTIHTQFLIHACMCIVCHKRIAFLERLSLHLHYNTYIFRDYCVWKIFVFIVVAFWMFDLSLTRLILTRHTLCKQANTRHQKSSYNFVKTELKNLIHYSFLKTK